MEISEYEPDELDQMANALQRVFQDRIIDGPSSEEDQAMYWQEVAGEVLEALEDEQ